MAFKCRQQSKLLVSSYKLPNNFFQFFVIDFIKFNNKSHGNLSSESQVDARRQTDRWKSKRKKSQTDKLTEDMNKPVGAFRDYANAPKTVSLEQRI